MPILSEYKTVKRGGDEWQNAVEQGWHTMHQAGEWCVMIRQ